MQERHATRKRIGRRSDAGGRGRPDNERPWSVGKTCSLGTQISRSEDRARRLQAGVEVSAHPVGERRDIEIDAFQRIGRALAVERQMQAVFAEPDVGAAPARRGPRAIGCDGAGVCAMVSQECSLRRPAPPDRLGRRQ